MNRRTHLTKAITICLLILFWNYPDIQGQGSDFAWSSATPESLGFSTEMLNNLTDSLAIRGTKKLMIIKNDQLIHQWFAEGWEDSVRTHYSASLAKALVGGLSLLVAFDNGWLFPDMPVCHLVPEWKRSNSKSKITIRQLATHTSGLEDAEVNEREQAIMTAKGLHRHMDLEGWKGHFWRKDVNPFAISRDSTPVLFIPGTHFNYSNPGIAMLSYAVSSSLPFSAYQDIRTMLWDKVYSSLGIEDREVSIGYNQTFETNGLFLIPTWGGGSFTANAAARIARLMLYKGNWDNNRIIDSVWVNRVTEYQHTAIAGSDSSVVSERYSLRTVNNSYPASTMGWYSNFDGVWNHVPRDAFAGAGAGHQLVLVIPSLDLIVVRFGADLSNEDQHEGFWTAAEKHLFNPIMDALIAPPYPQSSDISACDFASEEEVIRFAEGSDNWPTTWADDDHLYSAYGDGWGFHPFTEIKLSLGLAKIQGLPPKIVGSNLRSASGERVGQGKFGVKASGLLSVDGTLYMLARNAGNAQLAWSHDHGVTWEWADWRFNESFGCPTFLNYGRDYAGSRDEYVYIYSADASTAYDITDQMVLARVHKNEIIDQRSYQFLIGFDADQNPQWDDNVKYRYPVFSNPGKCYRSGITYNPGLGKYIWCQIIPLATELQGPRFVGGLGIFESDHPWGPWKTVYYTRKWDIGPGETISLPSKWISTDGKTAYLLFSGDDFFSLRQVRFFN